MCTSIDNCLRSGEAFNECDECDSGYSFPKSAANKLDRTQCVAHLTDVNCLMVDTNTNTCKNCKRGYSLNLDDKCENIKLNNCQTGELLKDY